MSMKVIGKTAGILVVSAIICTNLNGQDRNDVIKVYNEGAQSMQTDVQVAINAFEQVIVISDQVGETADDLKQKAMKVLPGLYVKVANNALKEKKPATEVIQAARRAKIMVAGYNAMAADFFANKDYDNALLAFDSLLVINPDYLNAVYNKALIYRTQDNADAFEETIDLFLTKLGTGTDDEKAKQASVLALEYFRAAGSQAINDNNLDGALVLLNKAAKYGDDKDLFYFFADAYNKQNKFDSGADYAQKGLDLETGDAEAKAKFYYQLAVAQVGKGDTASACESFKNAMYGPFTEASKAQRTNLKCE